MFFILFYLFIFFLFLQGLLRRMFYIVKNNKKSHGNQLLGLDLSFTNYKTDIYNEIYLSIHPYILSGKKTNIFYTIQVIKASLRFKKKSILVCLNLPSFNRIYLRQNCPFIRISYQWWNKWIKIIIWKWNKRNVKSFFMVKMLKKLFQILLRSVILI